MNASYSRAVNRVNRLTANLENAEYDLEYLKTIRREITKAQYSRRVKQLKYKIANLADELDEARHRSQEMAIKNRDKFFKTLKAKFDANEQFDVPFGNSFVSDADVLEFIAKQKNRYTMKVADKYYVINDATRNRLLLPCRESCQSPYC